MLIPNRPVDSIKACVCRDSPITARTSGGSSETEVTLLAVIPCTAPLGSTVVITVTPVANLDHASRYISAIDSAVCNPVAPRKFETSANCESISAKSAYAAMLAPLHPLDRLGIGITGELDIRIASYRRTILSTADV